MGYTSEDDCFFFLFSFCLFLFSIPLFVLLRRRKSYQLLMTDINKKPSPGREIPILGHFLDEFIMFWYITHQLLERGISSRNASRQNFRFPWGFEKSTVLSYERKEPYSAVSKALGAFCLFVSAQGLFHPQKWKRGAWKQVGLWLVKIAGHQNLKVFRRFLCGYVRRSTLWLKSFVW